MFDIIEGVNKYRDLIYSAEKYIWENPETGYVEYKTNKYMAEKFTQLGYKLTFADNITGFYTVLDTGKVGPTLLVFAEMDSLVVNTHPDCDKNTKAVHACGHNNQCAALLGVAGTLKDLVKTGELCGKIKLCVVPAEEGVVVEQIEKFREQGVIKYVSGKQEFMARGFFDDCDLAFMLHSRVSREDENVRFVTTKGSNGVIRKVIRFMGKSSHAGSDPDKGINALYSANLCLNAINSLRETFKDDDHIRVHPIISKGGLAVNAIPEEVVVECFVRGAKIETIKEINKKINRAIAGCAVAIGSKVYVRDRVGSEPLYDNTELQQLSIKIAKDNNALVCGGTNLKFSKNVLNFSKIVNENRKIVFGGHIVTPVFTNCEYSGFWFYASHLVEVCLKIYGKDIKAIYATNNNGNVSVVFDYDGFSVVGQYANECANCYQMTLILADKNITSDVDDGICIDVSCQKFIEMIKSKKMEESYEDLIYPVFIIEKIIESYTSNKKINL